MEIDGYLTIDELNESFVEDNSPELSIKEIEISKEHPLMFGEGLKNRLIVNKRLSSSQLKGMQIQGVKFYKCKFFECDFTGTLFWMSTFEDCSFEGTNMERCIIRKSEIENCQFIKCKSRFYLNISEGYVYNTNFIDCYFQGIEIAGTDTVNTFFKNTSLISGRYQSNFTLRFQLSVTPEEYLDKEDKELLDDKEIYDDLIFEGCTIEFMIFKMMNLMDTKFNNCVIAKCSISECIFYKYNFDASNNLGGWGTNSIDVETLAKSDILSKEVLKTLFNLEQEAQIEIKKQLNTKIMSSVFISYSLRDAKIANAINEYLKANNVSTFLWEQNAPGGKPLKSIMKSNIDSNDRLLFIASENSLKSEACHYELTQGRLKQDKLWKTILFPIHIDDFLFKIEYEMI